jgi:hypothetical protein
MTVNQGFRSVITLCKGLVIEEILEASLFTQLSGTSSKNSPEEIESHYISQV